MLFVVLPVHDRADVTERFARSLVRQTFADFQLVLVDDGCVDDTVARIRDIVGSSRLRVLRGDGHLWWAGALQMGFDHLRTLPISGNDAVLIINDDVEPGPTFLADGLQVLQEHPAACIQAVGRDRTTGSVDRGAIADLVRLRFREARPDESPNCLSTRGLLMRGGVFLASGGFRPRWLPHYLSDYEFTLRLRRHGVPLVVDPRFSMDVDLALTGMDRPRVDSVRRLWQDSLSNRAKFNPKHWSAFALMVCPPWVAPWHVLRIWVGFARSLARVALSGARET